MEILIIGVLILLLIAGVFVHNKTVARYKHAQEQIQKDVNSTQGILDTCKKDLSLMEKELGVLRYEQSSTIEQYNEMLMVILPRLFQMELSAFIHQQGIVRQVITFNDEKLTLAISTMLCIVLPRFDDIENPSQYAIEMMKRDHYKEYFQEHILSGRNRGNLRITGQSGYDALNIIIDAILTHGENGVIGSPKYNLVVKQPVVRV